jgi:hypothetical protein
MADKTKPIAWQGSMPELQGAWFGQETPGLEPVEFRPEILSAERSGAHVAGISFGPVGNEAFFTLNTTVGSADLMWMRMIDGIWLKPQLAPFNSLQIDNDICLSPDGQRLCWRSWRPLPGSAIAAERASLWTVDREGDTWSEPVPITCDGEIQSGWYPGIARSGTLYFSAEESPNEYTVYRANREGSQYGPRVPIIRGLKSGGDLCVAPDESFVVITCFSLPQFKGVGDLHVSFQPSPGKWTSLRNLGSAINTELLEYCPTISADGRWLFFCRLDRATRQGSAFWVDASIIDSLRPSP